LAIVGIAFVAALAVVGIAFIAAGSHLDSCPCLAVHHILEGMLVVVLDCAPQHLTYGAPQQCEQPHVMSLSLRSYRTGIHHHFCSFGQQCK